MGKHIIFEAWRGNYADNPRSLSEAIAQQDPETAQWWVVNGTGRDPEMPAMHRTVVRNSAAYFARLASATLLVSNDMMPRFPAHRPSLRYIQTWHGTPLKRIGFDHDPPGSTLYARRLARDIKRWSALLSPSPELTQILRAAFHYEGPVIESGYPRNDALVSETESIRWQAKRRLGLALDRRVVLYAPTWRETVQGGATWPASLEPRSLADRLGTDWVVLSRLHPVAHQALPPQGSAVLDVSQVRDIRLLYHAADALVTDYSSALFDFLLTDRPIVLYTPDLEEYRDQVRGFYFDLEDIAPGPVAATWEEVASNLITLPHLMTGSDYWSQRHRAARTRFCPLEDGNSARRIGRAILR